MSKIYLVAALLLSFSAQARQYIQCASLDINSWDRMVINLNDSESTLFMTNGVHLPDEDQLRILKPIHFVESNDQVTVYQARDQYTQETLRIPTEWVNRASTFFYVDVELLSLVDGRKESFKVSCFSSIYDK